MLNHGLAQGGRDEAHFANQQLVFKRVHQLVGKSFDFAGLVEALDDEVLAQTSLHDRSADHFAIENNRDAVDAESHVSLPGQGDHFVGSITIEGDFHGIRLPG